MNCHIFFVWPDDPGPVQEDISKTGRVGCCQSQVDAGEAKLIIHDCFSMMVKGWVDWVQGDQWVGLQGPRRSTGRFDGSSYDLEGRYMPIYIRDSDD